MLEASRIVGPAANRQQRHFRLTFAAVDGPSGAQAQIAFAVVVCIMWPGGRYAGLMPATRSGREQIGRPRTTYSARGRTKFSLEDDSRECAIDICGRRGGVARNSWIRSCTATLNKKFI